MTWHDVIDLIQSSARIMGKEHMKSAHEPRTEIAGFKLSKEELEELDRLVDQFGFKTRSHLLRFLALGACALALKLEEA